MDNKTSNSEIALPFMDRIGIIDPVVAEAYQSREHVEPLLQELYNHHPDTVRHSVRVAELLRMTAEELGYSKDRTTRLLRAGLLHDMGKRHIELPILGGTTALRPEERIKLEEHPGMGGLILREHKDDVAIFAEAHHIYQPDGYPAYLTPDMIKDPELQEDTRLLAIADVIDAMSEPRSYRPNRIPAQEVMCVLQRSSPHNNPGLPFFNPERVEQMVNQYYQLYPHPQGEVASQ